MKKFVSELRQRCYDAMNDDFQTQLVISYLFEACHVINTALDHKANISAEDLKELSDTMHLFTFDLLGLKSEKGANNDAREEAYGKVVDMLLNSPESQGCKSLGYERPYSRRTCASRFRSKGHEGWSHLETQQVSP